MIYIYIYTCVLGLKQFLGVFGISTLKVKLAVFASDSNIKSNRSEVNVLGSCRRIPGSMGKSLGFHMTSLVEMSARIQVLELVGEHQSQRWK